jgi:integrase
MATIREKGPGQWAVQIRRKGWPTKSKTLRTKKEAEIWARDVENSMDRGIFVDRSPSEKEALKQVLERYMLEVTDKRPGQASRDAERARIERFIRDEPDLCAYAMAHLQPEHFIEYRDRRLTETVQRGKPDGRGQYKVVDFVPKPRKDGSPRANAAKPKRPPKPPTTIKPGTVKKELMHLKSAIDYSRRRLGLVGNPVNATDVKRPTVNDERDVRLEPEQIDRLLEECRAARNPWLAPIVEAAFEIGARRGSLLRIEWRDIDLKQRTVTLRAVKNSRSPDKILNVAVGLSPRAIEILEALPRSEDEPRVFPITENALDSAFDRARVRAGVEHFNFHDTRHELASKLIEAGWSDSEVVAQTGHRDLKSLLRYVNLRKKHLPDKLAELARRDQQKAEKAEAA